MTFSQIQNTLEQKAKKLDVLTTVVDFLIFVIIYLLVKLLFNFNFKFWAHKY